MYMLFIQDYQKKHKMNRINFINNVLFILSNNVNK